MKIIYLLFISLIFTTNVVYATSGACSYHSGVNCSSGIDDDGSVICADGTRDSSVPYDFMVMCQDWKRKEINNYCEGEARQSIAIDMDDGDQYLKSIDKSIESLENSRSKRDMGNPAVSNSYNQQLAYLYTLKERQIQRYRNYLNDAVASCKVDKMNEYISSYKAMSLTERSTSKNEGDSSTINKNSNCEIAEALIQNGVIPPEKATAARTAANCKDIAPMKTNDQICKDTWPNSYFTELNDKGAPICDCPTSYQWNEQGTNCVVTPTDQVRINNLDTPTVPALRQSNATESAPLTSNSQKCQYMHGVFSIWSGDTDDKGELVCGCRTGYDLDQNKIQCIAVDEETEVKSFWSRFWGWFSF